MSVIDTTITRLQQIALLTANKMVKSAPQTPPESAGTLPVSVAYVSSGTSSIQSAGEVQMMLTIMVEIHVNLVTLKASHQQINAIIPDFLQRLAGDPTLNEAAVTIVDPVNFQVLATQWNNVQTLMAQFSVVCKYREVSK